MKQFTEKQVLQARERATPDVIQALIAGNQEIICNPVLVPETGCATWNHYFFCPEHSVRLIWNRHSPGQHRCPVDGAVFAGEPYDGAWWRWLNGLNAKASYELAVLWLLTQDTQYLEKVREILMGYARYYPEYEEHGGIPYNGPGKANAQTLCEANCHTDFARGFDIVRAHLSAEEDSYIANRLLRTGADFLMQHRCNQIHNHEVKISSAIGIIGAVLDDPAYLDFAVNSKYGLHYQLEHALLPDGMWFEGSLHYHYYALQGFFAFEKVAAKTQYSLMGESFYPKMLNLPFQMLMPDMTLPKINDCVDGQEKLTQTDIYEFAWWYYGEPVYGLALNRIYRTRARSSVDALFYGRALPDKALLPPTADLHAPDSGVTIIRRKHGRAVCVKHAPYGGEHDHYDRLGLIVFNGGRAVIPDLGTTGYGAPLHYGYYKKTFSHNTLCIDGQNQPPATPRVISFTQEDDRVQLITEVDWKTKPTLPDSKTRVEWDDEAYQDVVFRRDITVTGDLLIDVITVDNPHGQTVDTLYHIDGQKQPDSRDNTATEMLYPGVSITRQTALTGVEKLTFMTPAPLVLHCFSPKKCTLYQGKGPNNPSTSELEYVVMRSTQHRAVHVVISDLAGRETLCVYPVEDGFRVMEGDTELFNTRYSSHWHNTRGA